MQLVARRGVIGALVAALVVGVALVVLASASRPAEAAFPGTNGRIAFVSLRSAPTSAGFDVFTLRANGTQQRNLINDNAIQDDPAWSPDGKKIAFARQTSAPNWEIFVMNADGSGLRNLTKNAASDLAPAWAPDGKKIAFTSNRPGTGGQAIGQQVYTMNADGSRVRMLTSPIANCTGITGLPGTEAAWSPDGTRIAFDGHHATECSSVGQSGIFTIKPDRTGLRRITGNDAPGESDGEPSWSPDGKKIAFTRLATFSSLTDVNLDVYSVKTADGLNSGLRRLTTQKGRDEEPAWSPDGKKIAFQTDQKGNNEIFTMRARDGSNKTNLTKNAGSDLSPDWQAR